MKSATLRATGLAIVVLAWQLQAAEAIEGRWLLVSQQIGANKSPKEDLTLRIHPVGKSFEFAYSVPVNDIQFVSLRFTSRMDGTAADVTDANAKKIGTVKVTKASKSLYRIVLEGRNKPSTSGTMTISADGKTLTSESESKPAGQATGVRMIQVFSRQ